uniref:EF-hand domain-containing protein n=1 Tax=Macrostomum lignano TaxID=282301 RepID=A0A1I8GV34_9PLAT
MASSSAPPTSAPPCCSAGLTACYGCRPSSLDELVQRSKFNRDELKLMYRGFKTECPTGLLHRQAFREIFSQFFPLGDAACYADLVGTTSERLAWAFRLYDADGDGSISRGEMLRLVSAIYDLLGCCVSPRVGQLDVRRRAEQVFEMMDADKDGSVSFAEFETACRSGERDIDRELACFDTL